MALKVSGCVVMFVVFILTAMTYYLADKTIMSTAIVFQIAIGIVALLGLTVLCLVHTLDTTPADVSSHLFSGMIVLAYLGVIFDNILKCYQGNGGVLHAM